tara:strand:- start:741 stop:1163 length:423 start_codon:yes stop_codon:yes gene_type:complete
MKTLKLKFIFLSLLTLAGFLFSCSSDDEPAENITINEGNNGDIGGDFIGNGGSVIKTFTWKNSLDTADYNADITSTSTGVFQMIVKDADGTTVLDRTLSGGTEPDSFSGVTSSGTPGLWTVTISITNFNGDGSFSLSEGD